MRWMVIMALVIGCSAEDEAPAEAPDVATPDEEVEEVKTDPEPVTKLTVVDDLLFTTATDGVAPGFDLDGKVSSEKDESTCYTADFTSPDGTEGVDNKLAELVPIFELVGIGAAQGLIQDAIEQGGILLMLQVEGVDDLVDDPEVEVVVRAGAGVPLLGTDGKLLPGQTFHVHEDTPDSRGSGRIEDGVLHAGPLDVQIPIVVFGVRYDLEFLNTRLEATWTEDGSLDSGLLGGAVRIDDLRTIGEIAAADDASVLSAIEAVMGNAGDMDPDENGVCRQLSGTFEFSAVSAFLFPGEE